MSRKPSVWDEFTNLYSISKTLQFELIPSKNTSQALGLDIEQGQKFEKDIVRKVNRTAMKELFDDLHRLFIEYAFGFERGNRKSYKEFELAYTSLISAKKKYSENKDDQSKEIRDKAIKNFETVSARYRKDISSKFDMAGEDFKNNWNRILQEYNQQKSKPDQKTKTEKQQKDILKGKGIKVLTESGIMEVLKVIDLQKGLFELLTEEEKVNQRTVLVKEFDGFFTYFKEFQATRENLYKDDGTATAIPTRIINQNLSRFVDNIRTYEHFIKPIGDNFVIDRRELDRQEFKAMGLNMQDLDGYQDIFAIENFERYLTQSGIDRYNAILAIVNTSYNLYQQKQGQRKGKAIFSNLYKIMLSKKKKVFEELDGQTAMSLIKDYDQIYNSTLTDAEKILKLTGEYIISEDGEKTTNPASDKLYIKRDALSDISTEFFGGDNWDILRSLIKQMGYGSISKGEIKLDTFIHFAALRSSLEALGNGQIILSKKSAKSKKSNSKEINQTQDLLRQKKADVYTAQNLFKRFYFDHSKKGTGLAGILAGHENSTDLWTCFWILWEARINLAIEKAKLYGQDLHAHVLNQESYEPHKETDLKEAAQDGKNKALTQANLVKKYLDQTLVIWRFIKYFELVHDKKDHYGNFKEEQTTDFYDTVIDYLSEFKAFAMYDKIRNFSTQKPFSKSKFKLNFENSTLMAGWDINKEPDNTCILLRKKIADDVRYELVVLNNSKGTRAKQCFNKYEKAVKGRSENQLRPLYITQDNSLEKMEYKLLPGPNKMLPKVAFADSNQTILEKAFELYPDIYAIRENESFKKGDKFDKKSLEKWIGFFIEVLRIYPDWKVFDFQFENPSTYDDVSMFYRDVQSQGYKINFAPINFEELDKMEEDGLIFRFAFSSKDWQIVGRKGGQPNLQTIYWENLFTPENLQNPCFKLNGEGEIFLRPKSLDKDKQESVVYSKDGEKLQRKRKRTDIEENVVRNQRYTQDKLLLHVPISINFSSENITKFNDNLIKKTEGKDLNYIGIDRGANHLLYYCVIDKKGKILAQGSLNKLPLKFLDSNKAQDYHRLLKQKQDERAAAKESWSVIQKIKDLKAGYLSLAVHEICRLAIEHNAWIVMEDLNRGFKKRMGVQFEKSVFQKFETALATKLQYLVFKDRKPSEIGGALHGYQLCPPVDITKLDQVSEWGILKYVPARDTSSRDPLTGWKRHYAIYQKDEEATKVLFNPDNDNGIKIGWSVNHRCYTFTYPDETGKLWTLYSHKELERVEYNPNDRTNPKLINGTEIQSQLSNLLSKYHPTGSVEDNQSTIWEEMTDSEWRKLKYLFGLITQIRNKIKNPKSEENVDDVIQSACLFERNGIGVFFDSRQALQIAEQLKLEFSMENGSSTEPVCPLPVDGDANGAFHIALDYQQKTPYWRA